MAPKLPDAVAKLFGTIGTPTVIVLKSGKRVDLRTITVAEADKLVKEGCTYIFRLSGTNDAPATEVPEGKEKKK